MLKSSKGYYYIMKYIRAFINKFIPKELPKNLGRWNIENCNKKINHKIDLSNEDHCGPCGQYVMTKLGSELKNNVKSITIIQEEKLIGKQ